MYIMLYYTLMMHLECWGIYNFAFFDLKSVKKANFTLAEPLGSLYSIPGEYFGFHNVVYGAIYAFCILQDVICASQYLIFRFFGPKIGQKGEFPSL